MVLASLTDQLAACPTARHVVHHWSGIATNSEFVEAGSGEWDESLLDRGFARSGGALVAWRNMRGMVADGVRIVGAHTDSPGLHLKPRQGRRSAGQSMLEVEVYGGPLLSSWADRDLRVAGHLVLDTGEVRLFATELPVARISLLAIHLDREVNERGLVLDRHLHLSPMWGDSDMDFHEWLASQVGVSSGSIASWSAELADSQVPALIGRSGEYLAASRLDNQLSCWAAMGALLGSDSGLPSLVILFDHEEIGSSSATGAAGPLLEHILERLCLLGGGDRGDFLEMLRRSHCVSADNSHALHPNHPDRHHGLHAPILNAGVAVKTNVSQRYATDTESIGPILDAFRTARQEPQWFSSKNTVPCGSTIGPITATRLGIRTVDIGVPQLSMHSIREVCGTRDASSLRGLLAAYLER